MPFFLTGCGNVDKGITAPHHNPHFDIDESAFKYAASVFLKILELEHVFLLKSYAIKDTIKYRHGVAFTI